MRHRLTFQSSNDPWDMARSGMVNIDDITDTKNKPKVEVKPFTNDHRPLADLVREMPVKVRFFSYFSQVLAACGSRAKHLVFVFFHFGVFLSPVAQ